MWGTFLLPIILAFILANQMGYVRSMDRKETEEEAYKQSKEGWRNIRLGITGGGCAGFEYIFDSVDHDGDSNDVYIDYGKFGVVIDKVSVPYLEGMTLDYVLEGLNEIF